MAQVHAQRVQRSARASISPAIVGAKAPDGCLIIDSTATIDTLTLRYKVSVPAVNVLANAAYMRDAPKMGLNVLLHGDGGASFEDFPNKNMQGNLLGVVVLAPNDALLWGGQSTRQVQRPDGVQHAKAIDTFIRGELSKVVDFDMENVWFTGVSGGSLLLSGFFMPMFLSKYKNGVMLMCGGMAPPDTRPGLMNTLDFETLNRSRIHWQSTQQELVSLKPTIPAAIRYYETQARQAGIANVSIDNLQTDDAFPSAGHCVFDNKGFNSGIQLISSSWSRVMQGGDGVVQGIGKVNKGVIGNENIFP